MMVRRTLVLLFVIAVGSVLAYAGPRVEISDPACQSGDIDVFQLSSGFSTIPIDGGGTFHYCNRTGTDWTDLLLAIHTTAPAPSIDCPSYDPVHDPLNTAQLAFAVCLVFPSNSVPDTVYALFLGTFPAIDPIGFEGFPGVPNGNRFTVDLDCHAFGGCDPWPDGTVAVGVANFNPLTDPLPIPAAIPEPATIVLLASGSIGTYFRRKRQS